MRIRRVAGFLLLTFTLSWGYDALLVRLAGREAFNSLAMPPWGMFVPAAAALILELYFQSDLPLALRRGHSKAHWTVYAFLILTALYALLPVFALLYPAQQRLMQGLGTLLITMWTLAVIFISTQNSAVTMEGIGLGLGDTTIGARFILAAAAYFLLSSLFNLAFGLGSLQPVHERIMGIPIPSPFYIPALLLLFFAVTMIGGPLSGLASTFGEEYGWRRFLWNELRPLGVVAASFVSALIWGIWHIPVILRGIHTFPPTAAGILAGLMFFTLWGVLQSYAALKTGSIWTPAFMHGVVNSVYAFSLTYLVRPETALRSFGLGWYGLGVLGVLVIFALRDPVFRAKAVQSFPRHA